MKKLFSILSVSIAVLLITAFSIVPHHHHEEGLCMVMEMCQEDNRYNDQHTTHDTSEEASHHDNNCVTNTQYTAPTKGLKDGHVFENGDHLHLLDYISSLISYFILSPEYSTIQTASFRHVVSYKSALLGLSRGLRAPPYSLF